MHIINVMNFNLFFDHSVVAFFMLVDSYVV